MASPNKHMFLISNDFILQSNGQTNGIDSSAIYICVCMVNEPTGFKSDSCR